MNEQERLSFNERYLPLYEAYINTTDPDEAARLKAEMVQMELEVGLYGQL